jgi:hypothetical protein
MAGIFKYIWLLLNGLALATCVAAVFNPTVSHSEPLTEAELIRGAAISVAVLAANWAAIYLDWDGP